MTFTKKEIDDLIQAGKLSLTCEMKDGLPEFKIEIDTINPYNLLITHRTHVGEDCHRGGSGSLRSYFIGYNSQGVRRLACKSEDKEYYAHGAFLFSCTKIGLSHAEAMRKIKAAAKQATRDRAHARKEEEREREAHAQYFVDDLIHHFLHCSPAEFRGVLTRWRGDTRHTLGYVKCMTKLLKHPFTKQLLLDGSGNCECLGGGVSSAMHEITGKFLPVVTEKDVPAYGQFEYKLNYQGKEWVIYKFFKQFFKNGGRVRKEYVWRKQ